MSQKELEQGDQEVMGMVNGHSHPDAAAAAEEIAGIATAPTESCDSTCSHVATPVEMEYEEARREVDRLYRKKKRIEVLKDALCVVACLCTAAALVAAWYVPGLLIWVVNFGVLACGVVGAVKIEKHLRWWR